MRPAARSSSASAASVERPAPGDERVEVELAVHVEVDDPRDVALGVDRAVVGAEDALVGLGQRERIEARRLPGRRQPDDHGRAAERQRGDRRLGGLDPPDRVEHEVEAGARSARHGSPALASTVSVAPTRIATSSLAGLRSQATIRAACASRAPWMHRQPDAAAADHADRRVRRHARRVAHGADAGRDRAADDRDHVQRHVVADLHRARARHDDALRERGDTRGSDGSRRPSARCRRAARRRARRRSPTSSHCHGRPDRTAGTRRTAAPTTGRRGRRPRGRSTPSPSLVTTPAPSCPSTTGVGTSQSPRTTCRSEWHTPAAAIRTSTSPACGASSSTCVISTAAPGARSTAAFTGTAATPRSRCPART